MTQGRQQQAAFVPGQAPSADRGRTRPSSPRRRRPAPGAQAAKDVAAGTPAEQVSIPALPVQESASAVAEEALAEEALAEETLAEEAEEALAEEALAEEALAEEALAEEALAEREGAPALEEGLPGPPPLEAPADMFGRYTRDYATDRPGQQIAILHAGCATAPHDLGAARLVAGGADIVVTLIDDGHPAARETVAARPRLAEATLGDLRTVPLPPRSQDIVQCALLLHRISHAELVLDRLVAAVRPGGLLMLRVRDRDSAGGFFDRIAPGVARRLVWRARHPGQPGPYPAVYERLNSARGLQSYASLRGLVFAERQALGGASGGLRRAPHGYLALCALIGWLSRGRLTAAHEELVYVLRKPENRFARLI